VNSDAWGAEEEDGSRLVVLELVQKVLTFELWVVGARTRSDVPSQMVGCPFSCP
jgi:hypothetical protein